MHLVGHLQGEDQEALIFADGLVIGFSSVASDVRIGAHQQHCPSDVPEILDTLAKIAERTGGELILATSRP